MFGNRPTLHKRFELSSSSNVAFEIEVNLDIDMAKAAIAEMLKGDKAKEILENPYWPPEIICDGLVTLAEEEVRKYIRVNMEFK